MTKHKKLTAIQARAIIGMRPGREYNYDQLQGIAHAAQGLGIVLDSLQARGLVNMSGRRGMVRDSTEAERRGAARFRLTARGVATRARIMTDRRRRKST